jgi:hypothetical protein
MTLSPDQNPDPLFPSHIISNRGQPLILKKNGLGRQAFRQAAWIRRQYTGDDGVINKFRLFFFFSVIVSDYRHK